MRLCTWLFRALVKVRRENKERTTKGNSQLNMSEAQESIQDNYYVFGLSLAMVETNVVDIYNPDRGQGLDRRFQTRRVWPEGALAPSGQTRLVWNRRSSPARGLDCSSHMNFKPFMFLSVIYFRCPLTFAHPGLVPSFPCFRHSLPYFGHSVR